MKPPTVREKVAAAQDDLASMTTAKDLYAWASANGINSASGFSNFKKALAGIGVDYDAIRGAARAERTEEIRSAATHRVSLFSDAKASAGRFGITDEDGEPLWHGRFFGGEGAEQSAAELAAAEKAVWLAGKIAEAIGAPGIRLDLHVDAQWLTYANATRDASRRDGGKARVLGEKARARNIDLHVHWVPSSENPADAFTVCSGYLKWNENDLTTLAQPLGEEAAR